VAAAEPEETPSRDGEPDREAKPDPKQKMPSRAEGDAEGDTDGATEGEAPSSTEEQAEPAEVDTDKPEPGPGPDPGLSKAKLLEQALALSPGNTQPVYSESEIVSVFHDLQRDGLLDVAFVTVEGAQGRNVSLEELSRMNRLFDTQVVYPGFYIEVYTQAAGGTVSQFHTFYLGKKAVFRGFDTVPLLDGQALPVALSAVFYGRQGQERNWATFGSKGEVSLFIIEDTPAVQNAVLDVDNDGYTDVLEYRTTFEEGRGYETFVTWYRWGESSFVQYATTNVVRNLNRFMKDARSTLMNRDWKGFLDLALKREVRKAKRERIAKEPTGLIREVLEPLERSEVDAARGGANGQASQGSPAEGADEAFGFLAKDAEMLDVVFPDILENPFPDIGKETHFVAPVRVVCCGGDTRYFSMEIVMKRNPFSEQQFFVRVRGK
jgi:hypothetical protein